MTPRPSHLEHVRLPRRQALQAGAIGLLGLGANHVAQLQAEAADARPRAKSVIFIFLSGGLAQHESFDPKPDAPEEIRGEFRPIATRTPGVQICEHLPLLAARSDKWSMVRSLTHPYNEHSQGHMAMLTGRTPLPPDFNPSAPKPNDHPSICSIVGDVVPARNNLPPAIVLPEKLVHRTGRVIPGQFAGSMGSPRDPYFLTCSKFNPQTYGAWPEYGFHHARGQENPAGFSFMAPSLSLPAGINADRFGQRVNLLGQLENQTRQLERLAEVEPFDRFQQKAVSLLADPKMKGLFQVTQADEKTLDRYGRHVFGWSLLMARRLVESGVSLVQVNLGNNESWDTHGNAFPNLKNYLLPPMDQSVSALLDDLGERGLLDETLIVMAGEFGRTPKVFRTANTVYALPGRDHWGALQSVFLAGGGIPGGAVIGASDKQGGRPARDAQTPESLAATIYRSLGLPRSATWSDLLDRPMPVYHGEPIRGLIG
ncbi:DUF1501 domain-containing protein [Lignipirellula cremea]|uniref:Sulfatase n=1 Tax=Lignipirellula cremea TaxID=2528010 RepID=A0A518DMI6_9BACT|nr:DUF1501 domain-containing protein [Lignipirellula cremea]QDU93050.1 hypothetical protein Pla8534_08250 [Lignipirellula cremea]